MSEQLKDIQNREENKDALQPSESKQAIPKHVSEDVRTVASILAITAIIITVGSWLLNASPLLFIPFMAVMCFLGFLVVYFYSLKPKFERLKELEAESGHKEEKSQTPSTKQSKSRALGYVVLITLFLGMVFVLGGFPLNKSTDDRKTIADAITEVNKTVDNINSEINKTVEANKAAEQFFDPKTYIQVKNRTFTNERVLLDGHEYIGCTFNNVSFEYNGTGGFGFTNNTIKGSFRFRSGSKAVLATFALIQGLTETNIQVVNDQAKPVQNIQKIETIR